MNEHCPPLPHPVLSILRLPCTRTKNKGTRLQSSKREYPPTHTHTQNFHIEGSSLRPSRDCFSACAQNQSAFLESLTPSPHPHEALCFPPKTPKPREFHIKNSTPLLHLAEACHDWLLGDTPGHCAGGGSHMRGAGAASTRPRWRNTEHSGGCEPSPPEKSQVTSRAAKRGM